MVWRHVLKSFPCKKKGAGPLTKHGPRPDRGVRGAVPPASRCGKVLGKSVEKCVGMRGDVGKCEKVCWGVGEVRGM